MGLTKMVCPSGHISMAVHGSLCQEFDTTIYGRCSRILVPVSDKSEEPVEDQLYFCHRGHITLCREGEELPPVCQVTVYYTVDLEKADVEVVCGAPWDVSREIVKELRKNLAEAWAREANRSLGIDISDVVHPDAPTVENERGGKQSHVPVRFDLIDGKAMFAMAAVLHEGAEKYAPGNWRLIPERDHLNHALMHIYAYLSGDRTDDHLSHALCRITFATAVNLDPEAGPERDE